MLSDGDGAFGLLCEVGWCGVLYVSSGAGSVRGKMCAVWLGCESARRNPKGVEVSRGCHVSDAGTGGLGESGGGQGAIVRGWAFGMGNLALDANAAREGGGAEGGEDRYSAIRLAAERRACSEKSGGLRHYLGGFQEPAHAVVGAGGLPDHAPVVFAGSHAEYDAGGGAAGLARVGVCAIERGAFL